MSLEKDKIDELFESLHGAFDTEEPMQGHEERFLDKLDAAQGVVSLRQSKRSWWKPLSIAASVVLLIGLGIGFLAEPPTVEDKVAKISPEASQTHFYFANLIEEQVRELEKQDSPETRKIIEDTMIQLQKLEQNYNKRIC